VTRFPNDGVGERARQSRNSIGNASGENTVSTAGKSAAATDKAVMKAWSPTGVSLTTWFTEGFANTATPAGTGSSRDRPISLQSASMFVLMSEQAVGHARRWPASGFQENRQHTRSSPSSHELNSHAKAKPIQNACFQNFGSALGNRQSEAAR
jgi:hypothetical protein